MVFTRMIFSRAFTAEHAAPKLGRDQNAENFLKNSAFSCDLSGEMVLRHYLR